VSARPRPLPRLARALLCGALLLAAGGCGNPTLWARYRAERDSWHARKLVDRVRVNPRFATPHDYARARAAFEAITRRFPASTWDRAWRPGTARDVAVISGSAAISCAHLDELSGNPGAAIAGLERIEREWAAVRPVARAAAIARAESCERAGRLGEAAQCWRAVALADPWVDPASGAIDPQVAGAAAHAAGLLRGQGRGAAADSLLDAVDRRESAALATGRASASRPDHWERLAGLRVLQGDTPGALAAMRSALADSAARRERPRLLLGAARLALEGGRPDSARAYAALVDSGYGRGPRADGRLVTAEAWEVSKQPDSALTAYAAYLDMNSQNADGMAEARFRRGGIYERTGRWEQAHSEYRALQAAQPTHPLAFASMLRIVNHHLERGETDLAHLEARNAVDQLDQILATQSDDTVALEAGATRAELLVKLDRAAEACDALTALWRRYGHVAEGAGAGLEAAALAERALGDPARARDLYEEIATHAADRAARDSARVAALRLGAPRN